MKDVLGEKRMLGEEEKKEKEEERVRTVGHASDGFPAHGCELVVDLYLQERMGMTERSRSE